MGTGSINSLANIAFLATISTSVFNFSNDSNWSIPVANYDYNHPRSIAEWKENAFNITPNFQLQDEHLIKFQAIIEFSNKVLINTKDIDSEFVDIVNENFWELI